MSQGGSRVGWNSLEHDGPSQAALGCQGCNEPGWESTGLGPWGLHGFWEDRDPTSQLMGVGEFLKDTLGAALSLGAMQESRTA